MDSDGRGTIGYSTHGVWTPAREIYELEEERGNVVDLRLLQEGLEAIWITMRPEDAVRYNRIADEEDKPVTQEEIEALLTVDLDGAEHIEKMDDGDGGQLWVREEMNLRWEEGSPHKRISKGVFEGTLRLRITGGDGAGPSHA